MTTTSVSLDDIHAADARIRNILERPSFWSSPILNRILGFRLLVKAKAFSIRARSGYAVRSIIFFSLQKKRSVKAFLQCLPAIMRKALPMRRRNSVFLFAS